MYLLYGNLMRNVCRRSQAIDMSQPFRQGWEGTCYLLHIGSGILTLLD